MSVGAAEAARAVGLEMQLALAVDVDPAGTTVARRIFGDADIRTTRIEDLLGPAPGRRTTKRERSLAEGVGSIDLLVGGPPCQGHSNLNNHTRGDDDRNALALRMVRFAELVEPRFVIMENVLGIVRDRGRVLERVRSGLEKLGYGTAEAVLKAEQHGVPQTRHRVFLLAVRNGEADRAMQLPRLPHRSFSWACGDLSNVRRNSPYDGVPITKSENRGRIEYLFDNRLWDLPDHQRPLCHRNGGHKYKSIYGRLYWDRPAQTITTGFRCMGQGRFVHPRQRRTITAHEAARLQTIPDFVHFDGVNPSATAVLIGNAVPPSLVYGLVLNLLTQG